MKASRLEVVEAYTKGPDALATQGQQNRQCGPKTKTTRWDTPGRNESGWGRT